MAARLGGECCVDGATGENVSFFLMLEFGYYLLPTVILLLAMRFHLARYRRSTEVASKVLKEAVEAGLTEPPSLHPVVDLDICMGSGTCAAVCPEKALGVINGKAVLINPTHCIGHGACAPACPVGAIKLVFGTAKRGVDIPAIKPNFETNVPGIFIAGELGGMGLIRNAVKQGVQAIHTIAEQRRGQADFDVAVIGAGPAGIAATLAAKEAKLKCLTIEQEDSFGGTTYHYPRGKLVMTAPLDLPLAGKYKLREVSKEELMRIWNEVVAKGKITINFSERLEDIASDGGSGFTLRTNKATYTATSVLLALGRRGTPRKLGVPGEDHPKVVYRLIEPKQYAGMNVLVVGGGDSALEAAMDCAQEHGTTVTLAYRGKVFDRVKPKNRERLEKMVASNRVILKMETTIKQIGESHVDLKQGDDIVPIPNDAVIVCAGGELPTPMLKKIGIQVEAHYGA